MPSPLARGSLLSSCLVASALAGLPACGGGGGGGEGPAPTEDTVTLSSLSEAERQAFEAWKQQPIKACEWYEAFPTQAQLHPAGGSAYSPGRPTVDLARFLEVVQGTAGGLPVLLGPAGELVLFEAPEVATSLERRSLRERWEVNGRAITFEVSSQRDRGDCVIALGGEEVFRGRLADRVPAALGYDPQEPRGAGVPVGAVEEAVARTEGSTSYVVGRMAGTPLVDAALATLAPDARTYALLAGSFGVTPAQAETVFRASASEASAPAAAALVSAGGADLAGTTVFAPGRYVFDAAPVAGASALSALRREGAVRLDLLYAPALAPSGPLLRLEATVQVTAAAEPVAALSSVRLGAARPRADADAVRCFLARHAAAAPFPASARSYEEVYGPCRPLAADGTGALASAAEATAVVVGEAAGRGPAAGGYAGWKTGFLDLVDGLVTRGALSELDPTAQAPALCSHAAELEQYLAAVPDPDARRALRRDLVALSFDPFFAGRALTAEQRGDVVAALGKAAVPFRDSTAAMLQALMALDPSGGLAAARCGAGLTAGRIQALEQAIAGAAAYAYGLAFSERLRGGALQACHTPGDLDAVAAAVAAAQEQTTAEATQEHGPSYERAHQATIDHALEERWTRGVYRTAADVLAFATVSEHPYCGTYATLSEQLWCAGGSSLAGGPPWQSGAPGGALDPALGGRYGALARDLRARFLGSLADDGLVRMDIEAAFFGDEGLWLTCGAEAFAARRAELFRLLDRLEATSGLEQMDVEDAIEELVGSSC